MAPEVHKGEPYNLSADIYSLSILCWEVLEMEKPFDSFSTSMHADLVINKGYRPKCNEIWPRGVTDMLKLSWSAIRDERPTATILSASIQHELICY